MYIREKDGIIYVYRNQELFLESMKGINNPLSHRNQMMLIADYALQIVPGEPTTAQLIKDRSGVFSSYLQKLEKMLKIIAILREDS